MPRVDRAARGIRGDCREERGVSNTETHLLAFHIPARLLASFCFDGRLCNSILVKVRIAASFVVVSCKKSAQEKDGHGGEHSPAVLLVSDHPSKRVGEPRPQAEDRNHLEEICKRCRVLKRMRRVRIEESASVCAQFLDDFLRSNRTLSDALFGNGFGPGDLLRLN